MKPWGLAILALLGAAPAAAQVSLRDLVEVVDVSSLSISPDGRHVAFRQDQASLARNARELTWWVADLDGRPNLRRVANGGRALWTYAGTLPQEPAQWSSDSRRIYFRALLDGQVQVWRGTVAGEHSDAVTSDPADVVSFSLAADGTALTYSVGPARAAILDAEERQQEAGVRIDASVDVAQNLFAAGEINGRMAAQRLTGKWFRRAGLLSETPLTKRTVRLDGAEAGTLSSGPNQASDGSKSAFGEIELADGALRVRRPDGRIVELSNRLEGRASWAVWRPGHDEVMVAAGDLARRQALYLWSIPDRHLRKVLVADGLAGGGDFYTPCALSARVAVCVLATPTSPPRLARLDLETKALTELAAPNRDLHLTPAGAVKPLEWTAPDGTRFAGWLYLPPGGSDRRSPLFITYYLCDGYLRGGLGDEYPLTLLAQKGIAALCVNKAAQSPQQYDAVGDYRRATQGIDAIIAQLGRDGLIDPKRVGMGGFSFGSEVTTWIIMNSSMLAAASIASTQIEPAYYWLNGVAGRDNHSVLKRSWGLGAPDETPERWREVSPALNTGRIHTPLLLQMPEQEYRLSFELFARLTHTTTPVDLYAFPGEPHIKTQPRHRLAVYQRNLDWFGFWLAGEVDPDPAKVEQYARWREMANRQVLAQDALAPASSQP
ncbi:Atxe2 family lasso peptide isopeptidase [Caulobacter sp. CCH5-E12]|uniref:Atxe2 family lasso peptide isopeptidase n=1 Tax=Caulobacter sp. CCH5-E12 TaxID=1768770 RepID=UPI000A96C5B3|nr:Atxe2 family lasso peptide isopeptidase [Caulobacter sp. CCH5-E12]